MKQHPNKHIQAAIDYALSKGWIWVAAGGAAHCFCRLRCGNPEGEHKTHQMSVWSTRVIPKTMPNRSNEWLIVVNDFKAALAAFAETVQLSSKENYGAL